MVMVALVAIVALAQTGCGMFRQRKHSTRIHERNPA